MEIDCYDSSGTRLATVRRLITPSKNNTWEKFIFSRTLPAGTKSIIAYIYIIKNGRVWINSPKYEIGENTNPIWTPSLYDLKGDSYTENLVLKSDTYVNNSAYNIGRWELSEKPVVGDLYTFTIWGNLGEGKYEFGVFNSGGNVVLVGARKISDGVYSGVFRWKNTTSTGQVFPDTHVWIWTMPSSVTSVSTINRIKLEKGINTNPVWTPASKDMLGIKGESYTENLLLNTSFHEGFDGWNVNARGTKTLDSTITLSGRKSVVISATGNTGDVYSGMSQVIQGPKVGDTLTVSMWVYTNNLSSIDNGVIFEIYPLDSNNTSSTTGAISSSILPSTQGVWEKKRFTYTVPSGAVKLQFNLLVRRNGVIWISSPKIEYGDNPDPVWSPNGLDCIGKGVTENLYTNSFYLRGTEDWNFWRTPTSKTYSLSEKCLVVTTNSDQQIVYGKWVSVKKDEKYTLSGWVKASKSIDLNYTFLMYSENGNISISNGNGNGNFITPTLATTSWGFFVCQFTAPRDGLACPGFGYLVSSSQPVSFYLKDLKWEKGWNGSPVWIPGKEEMLERGYTNNLLLKSDFHYKNSAYNIAKYTLTEKPVVGEIYTITIWGDLGAGKQNFGYYNTGDIIWLGTSSLVKTGVYSAVVTWRNTSSSGNVVADTELWVYAVPKDSGIVSEIKKIKMERGYNPNPVWSLSEVEKEDERKYTTNLLLDSGFFHGLGEWSHNKTYASIDSGKLREGRKSVKINVSGATSNLYVGIQQSFDKGNFFLTAKEGDTHTISLWSYTDDTSTFDSYAVMDLYYYDASKVRITNRNLNIVPTVSGEWQKFVFKSTAPTGTAYIVPFICIAKNGCLWINSPKLEIGENTNPAWTPSPYDGHRDSFIDMVTQIPGVEYNHESGLFSYNPDLQVSRDDFFTDITYDEMLNMYNRLIRGGDWSEGCTGITRVNLEPLGGYVNSANNFCVSNSSIKSCVVGNNAGIEVAKNIRNCSSLVNIIGEFTFNESWESALFSGCPALENVAISVVGQCFSLNLSQCSSLSPESLSYLIRNAKPSTTSIQITLHKNAYSRLTSTMLTEASAKRIVFIQA